MKTTFRFPGSAEYSYAELTTTEGSPQDNARELRDIDDAFLNIVGNLLSQGCTLVAMGPLRPQVLSDAEPAWNDPASMPQWASQPPQEAQGYQGANQAYNAPQNGSQGYQTGNANYQGYHQPSPQAGPSTPPGMQAPTCQMHGRPADYKPAGTSKKTGRPYNAFWACAAGANDCTRASNFPRL